ncbi:MAG: hypothetical protein AAB598_00400 [Patescibacteria group bacterium]
MIYFTAYAQKKFLILERHGVLFSREAVVSAVESPDAADDTKKPLVFARKKLNDSRMLCVVYKKEAELKKIITFYPL